MIPPFLALFASPLIIMILFRRLPVSAALCASLIGGYLLLPEKTDFDLPILPILDKHTIPSLTAFAILLLRFRNGAGRKPLRDADDRAGLPPGWIPKSLIGLGLIALTIGGIVLTALSNTDTLVYGPTIRPAITSYDCASAILTALLTLLPMLLARKVLATEEGHRTLLIALSIAGVGYAFPALFEVRMSPHLNDYVYGFNQIAWKQHLRGGGFRPAVFLHHGLWLAIFFACTLLATLTLIRIAEPRNRSRYIAAGVLIFLTIALSNSLGAFLIAVVMAPLVLLLTVRLQLLAAALLTGTILLYPALRGADLVPVQRVMNFVESIDTTRAASLQTRLDNEDMLLEKANERSLFGWGLWGRNKVFDEKGRRVSITDGGWIIQVGMWGWVGYIGRYGLLALPILMLALRPRRYDVTMATSGLCLVLTANMVDMIPNGTETVITWMIAGAILGRLEVQPVRSAEETPQTVRATPRKAPSPPRDPAEATARERSPYTRFPPSSFQSRPSGH